MQNKVISTAMFFFSVLPGAVIAGIHIGNDRGTNGIIAWPDGDYPCAGSTLITAQGQNPCAAGKFKLSNGYTYQLAYCGTDSFALLNDDGSYNSKCNWDNQQYQCNVESTYYCA